MEEITSSVGAIEAKAGKILEEGQSRANEILLKANEEAGKILSSKLPMDEAKMECEQLINKAREEADEKVEEAKEKASKIRTDVEKKMEKIIGRVVGNITGAELR